MRWIPGAAEASAPSMPLEILHLALMLLRRLARLECPQVPPLAGLLILLA